MTQGSVRAIQQRIALISVLAAGAALGYYLGHRRRKRQEPVARPAGPTDDYYGDNEEA